MIDKLSNALITMGVVLALGMSTAGYVLGFQAKQIGGKREHIAVKGLAEKRIAADTAEWTVGLSVKGKTRAAALTQLRKARPALDAFLKTQGLDKTQRTESVEQVEENEEYEFTKDGSQVQIIRRDYLATQNITLFSQDLARIGAAHRAIVDIDATITYSDPAYLVSNLEEVKMSLIGAATENARARAEEFAKKGNAVVGPMRSAEQGAFYIVPFGVSDEDTDTEYGGTYDKSTVEKIARVVVTIEYGVESE